MAANSLLYLLLTSGLTTPPDQSVTTESPYDFNNEYTRDFSYGPSKETTEWPGYGGKPQGAMIRWRQEPRYTTEDPSHQYTARSLTKNNNANWRIFGLQTERPFERSRDETDKPYDWLLTTEEPEHETESQWDWPWATEKPEDETERPESWSQKKNFNNEYTRDFSYGPSKETTQWPGYGGKPQGATIRWRQEPRYTTEDPSHQYTARSLTKNKNANWRIFGLQTERPFERSRDETDKPYDWLLTTEEPEHETESQWDWPRATEKPEDETERPESWSQKKDKNANWRMLGFQTLRPFERRSRDETDEPYDWLLTTEKPEHEAESQWDWPRATETPEDGTEGPESWSQKKGRKKCPPREHFSKCNKNCEKTCSNYMNKTPCPRSCEKGCVCDGGLVRNEEQKCVPRDQCKEKLMTEDDDSHGCPFEYTCDIYCVTIGQKLGHCEGNTCKCFDR